MRLRQTSFDTGAECGEEGCDVRLHLSLRSQLEGLKFQNWDSLPLRTCLTLLELEADRKHPLSVSKEEEEPLGEKGPRYFCFVDSALQEKLFVSPRLD